MTSQNGPLRKYKEVGERLRKAREEAGFARQTDLADAAGLVPLTINRVEKGRAPLGKKTAEKLAPLLHKSASFLLYGSEQPEKKRGPLPVVRQYLTDDPYGREASPRAKKLLEAMDFSAVGISNPKLKDVHRAHEWIEINLALDRQRSE